MGKRRRQQIGLVDRQNLVGGRIGLGRRGADAGGRGHLQMGYGFAHCASRRISAK
jgi:hypothetical protein